jgi:hypothetical protein
MECSIQTASMKNKRISAIPLRPDQLKMAHDAFGPGPFEIAYLDAFVGRA